MHKRAQRGRSTLRRGTDEELDIQIHEYIHFVDNHDTLRPFPVTQVLVPFGGACPPRLLRVINNVHPKQVAVIRRII